MSWTPRNVKPGDRVSFPYRERELADGTVKSVHAEGFTIIAGDNKRLVACTTSKLLPPRSKSTGTAAAPTAEQLNLFSESGAAA